MVAFQRVSSPKSGAKNTASEEKLAIFAEEKPETCNFAVLKTIITSNLYLPQVDPKIVKSGDLNP